MSTNRFPNSGPRLGDVRVVTLNLWGRRGAWADRRSVLIDGLRALQPDLVAFQEAIMIDDYDQVIDLLGPGSTLPTSQAERLMDRASRSLAAGP